MILKHVIITCVSLHGKRVLIARETCAYCTGNVCLLHGKRVLMNAVSYEWQGLRGG